MQKDGKSSPRWQCNSLDIKRNNEIKTANDLIEDERDPDVIPPQFSCEYWILALARQMRY